MPKLFISYRRQDSGPIARRLAETLIQIFGEEQVFLDTDSIRTGQNWPATIEKALAHASVLLPVIGPQWLHIHNEYGQRRIDVDSDWVRSEVIAALGRDIHIFPILVSGASPLASAALPELLAGLANKQAYELKDEYWKRDIPTIVKALTDVGFNRVDRESTSADLIFPPPVETSKALTEEELDDALSRLPKWRVVKRLLENRDGGERIELYRSYRFKSFEDAMHFMLVAARYAAQQSHHPDWQNLWISVRVWLTTWDIGHRPSFKDVRLAEYLDKLYVEYVRG